MGTQQILLIVLSVIIVGVAIAVGITMFNNQAYNSNQQAVSGELQNYGAQAIQFWKTPISQGGAGQAPGEVSVANVAQFIGFIQTGNTLSSENGIFEVTTAADTVVVLTGIGNTVKNNAYPMVTTTVLLNGGIIRSVVSTDADGAF
jgi:hypothetical protein